MNIRRRKELVNNAVEKATELLNRLWKERAEIWSNAPHSPEELFPLDPAVVIDGLLNLKYEQPVEIPSVGSLKMEQVFVQTAGFMDRKNERIVVAQGPPEEWRRFTAAHEIGHWLMHSEMISHRDRPLTGAERETSSRSSEEFAADAFAAELLMPRKILRAYFEKCFHHPINGREPNEDAEWLASVADYTIDTIDVVRRGVQYRAFLVAGLSSIGGKNFVSLADRFGVSPSAMAIQLRELELVK
jgi:IrrE N-terminal-like domain